MSEPNESLTTVEVDGVIYTVGHVTLSIDETCVHEWEYVSVDGGDGEEPSHCTKCGLSFTRYIFCCCP